MYRIALAFLMTCSLVTGLYAQQDSAKKENQKPAPAAGKETPAKCGDRPYCAETGRQFKPETPIATPRVNQVFRDPDFGSRMIRVTDEGGVKGNFPGFSFTSNASAETNEWGRFNPSLGPNGGYYFYVMTSGGGAVPLSMDASTMQVSPQCGSLPRCRLESGGSFSYVDPNVIYGHFGSSNSIEAYDISSGKQKTIYDFTKCPGLPGDISGYPGAISNSGDDTKFSDYAGGRMQGFGSVVTFYDRSTGHCYWYDTATARLGGSGMETVSIKAGTLSPPAAPRLTSASGNLPAGDYYVQLTANTVMHPDPGETLPSPEVHIHLNSAGGVAISAPEIDNRYGTIVTGYSVFIGTASGQEMRQVSALQVHRDYTQSAPLSKGASPPKISTAGYDVHNARLSRDGKVVKVVPQNGQAIYLWQPGTVDVSACSTNGQSKAAEVASFCGGHTVMGYTHLINAGGPGGGTSLLMRPINELTNITQLMPAEITVPASMDSHWSWNNADASDSTPVCGSYSRSSFKLQGDGTRSSSTNPVLGVRQAFDREIVCASTSGPHTIWRFAHHHATGACNSTAKDGSCFGAIAIGNVSQDGKFFLFSSDWDWSLGSDPHTGGCPASGRCRVDAFIVELK
jgi:hypothetical protein